MYLLKMQIACFLILLYLTMYFFRKKRPALAPTLLFRNLLMVGSANLLFDCLSSLSVSNLQRIPIWLNRVCHQLFFGTLVVFAFLLCSYILEQVQPAEGAAPPPPVLLWAPLGLGLLMVLVAPLSYQTSGMDAYPFGLMAMAVHAVIIAFCGIGIFVTVKFKARISAHQREALQPILWLTAVLSLLQLIFPMVTLSGVSISLMSLGIFLSLDNPDEFLTQSGTMFNRQAFSAMTRDWLRHGKKFSCVFVCYQESAMLEEKFGKDTYDSLIEMLNQYVAEKLSLPMYLPLNGTAALLVQDEKQVLPVTAALSMRFNTEWMVLDVPIALHADIHTFTMPEPYDNCDDLLNAVMEKANETQSPVVTIDRKTGIKNKLAYDRDSLQMYQNKKAYSTIHYLIADINGLNKINKEHGHIEGDKLLQDCALVLQTAAGEGVDVYRMGGDEFGILLVSKSDTDMRALLERIQSEREMVNKVRKVPLNFAMGYSKFYPDSDRSFNPMMERAEYQMNNQKRHMKQDTDDDIITTRLGTRLFKF